MSINKIIVNTTTGQEAADSINEVIDLAEAAATLGSNEFTGDQLVNGTSRQIFPTADEGYRLPIAKVTGVAVPAGAVNEVNFGWTGAGGDIPTAIQRSWTSEVFFDSTRARGSTHNINVLGVRSETKNVQGKLGLVDLFHSNVATNYTAYADNMNIGALAAETRNVINIGHDALPNVNLRGVKLNLFGNVEFNNLVVLVDYPNLNFADDAAAEAGNVPLGGVYHNNGALRVRVA